MTRVRRVLSLLVALLPTVGGLALLVIGFSALLAPSAAAGVSDELLPLLLVAGGSLLVAVGVSTLAWASLGLGVVAVLEFLLGLAVLLPAPGAPGDSVAGLLMAGLGLPGTLSLGLAALLPGGLLLGLGVLSAGLAFGATYRRRSTARRGSARARLLSLLVLPLAVLGSLALLLGAARLLPRFAELAQPAVSDPGGVLLVLGGGVLLALCGVTVRWSSLGAALAGLLVTTAAVLGPLLPGSAPWLGLLPLAELQASPAAVVSLLAAAALLPVGAALLVGALAARLAALLTRRERRPHYKRTVTEPIPTLDELAAQPPRPGTPEFRRLNGV